MIARPLQRFLLGLAALAVPAGLGGCGDRATGGGDAGDAHAATIEVTDDRGQTVTLDGPPKRVAAMTSFAVEILMAMGNKPVARFPDPDLYPPEAGSIPEVDKNRGNRTHKLEIEQLIATDPDLVILHTMYAGVAENVGAAVGAPVLVLNITSIEDLRQTTGLLAGLSGDPGAAERLMRDTDRTLAWLEGNKPATRPRALSLLGMGANTWYCHRGNHFMGSLLEAAGADNIAADREAHGRIAELSPIDYEALIQYDPEVIFLIPYGDRDADAVIAEFKASAVFKDLSAVKSGRFHVLPDTIYTSQPGPRAGEALQTLFKHLHPEAEAPDW